MSEFGSSAAKIRLKTVTYRPKKALYTSLIHCRRFGFLGFFTRKIATQRQQRPRPASRCQHMQKCPHLSPTFWQMTYQRRSVHGITTYKCVAFQCPSENPLLHIVIFQMLLQRRKCYGATTGRVGSSTHNEKTNKQSDVEWHGNGQHESVQNGTLNHACTGKSCQKQFRQEGGYRTQALLTIALRLKKRAHACPQLCHSKSPNECRIAQVNF